jgi:hypothetical protein
MAVVKIRTPQGVKQFRIAGDTPSEEETAAIKAQFFNQAPASAADPAQAAPEEPAAPVRDIDYDTGVQDTGFRYTFSKGDNEAERRARLESLGVPAEAVQIDQDGEYILDRDLLPEDIKTKYNIKGTGLLAIDEKKGFTKNDWVDFAGEARGPLVGGLTASLAASGVGLIPAAIVAGTGSALGYLFDEYQEDQEGLRRETDEELGRGVVREFAFGGIGEGAGRGLTALLGRVFKGSGSQSANEARAASREVLKGGGKPTLREANESPILGRLQAIYEGVYPNKKAAKANAVFVAREMATAFKAAGTKAVDEDALINLLNRDIERIYGNPEDLIRQANGDLKNMVNTGLDDLIRMFGDETKPLDSKQIARTIDVAKRIFDEDVDVLYTQANKLLGKKELVPTETLVKKFKQLADDNPSFNLKDSGLGKFISRFETSDGVYRNATVLEMNGVRTALREAGFDPTLVGTMNGKFIGDMLGTIDQSFRQARVKIREDMLGGATRTRNVKGQITGKTEDAKSGLDLLDKANAFYGKGIERFRDTNAERIFRAYKDKSLDVEELFDPNGVLLTPNRGATLNKFFKSVVPGGRDAVETPRTFEAFLRRGGMDADMIKALPDDDYLKSTLRRKFTESVRFADEVNAARGAGIDVSQAVRNSMAKNYLTRIAQQNTNIYGTFNASAMVDQISKLGSTGEVLFGKQYKTVINTLSDLGTINPKIADDELARMAGLPIADQVSRIRGILKQQDDLATNTLAKGISRAVADADPDRVVDLVFRRRGSSLSGPAAIKQAEEALSPETMDAIRQKAMERILSQLPDAQTGGKEFMEKVLSGQYSTQLNTILDAYGKETIDAMFGEAGPLLRQTVKKSATASNLSTKGLGALAPATIATSLGLISFIANPLGTALTMVGIKLGASILRSKLYLGLVTRPTGVRPGKGEYDQVGRLFEMAYEAGGQSAAQQVGNTSVGLPSLPTVQSTQAQEQQQRQAASQDLPDVYTPLNIQPPQAGTAGQVSPILLPDPATAALAQSLGRTTP